MVLENTVSIQRSTLPMRRPPGNAGGSAATMIQHRVRNAKHRARRAAIGDTRGRGGLGSIAMSWSSSTWRSADSFLRGDKGVVFGRGESPPVNRHHRNIHPSKDFRSQDNV